IFSGAGIAHFEDVIASNIALVFFLPLLVDSGGNAGSQSATLMIRAMAVGDIKMKDWLKMFVKEISVSVALGLTMALAVRSEEHTSELQSRFDLVCRLLLEKKK